MRPAQSIMIRVGSSSQSVVNTVLSDFHSKTIVSSGFYVCYTGEEPPPPVESRQFGSQETSPPYLRLGHTVFVDPYGLPELPATLGTFYFYLTNSTSDFSLSWANAYSGTCKTVLPDGPLQTETYTEQNDVTYIRVNTQIRPYRLFNTGVGSNYLFVLVGPLNISKVVPAGASFILSELIGIPSAKFGFVLAGSTAYIDKVEAPVLSEESGLSVSLSLFDEKQLGSGTFTSATTFRCLVLQ